MQRKGALHLLFRLGKVREQTEALGSEEKRYHLKREMLFHLDSRNGPFIRDVFFG